MSHAQVPPGTDQPQPSVARVYDYLLGGETNFPADRAAAEMMKSRVPELIDSAFANRGFHQRAAKWIAQHGVSQFIDLGSGLPTVGNTHEVVRTVVPDARVVYVDNDPVVLEHGTKLLADDAAAAVLLADLRDPDTVLASEEMQRLIDPREPVAVLMTAVLHFVSDAEDPAGLIARYLAPFTAGSYLALSHMTADHKPPVSVQVIREVGFRSAGGGYLRSKDEIRRLFGGLEVVTPYSGAPADVTWVGMWNCEDPMLADTEGSRWLYCGVARKPG